MTYLAHTVLAGFSLLSVRFAPSSVDPAGDFVAAQLVGALGYPVVAWLLLGTADDLAARLFPEVPAPFAVGPRDLLVIGLALVGISVAASAVPALVQGLGLAVYYGEASRQGLAEARFEREWPELVREALTFVVGVTLAAAARPIASRLRVVGE